MPKMDGYELTQTIRREEKPGERLPIVALTANALKGEAEHCLEISMSDYRSKPTPMAELKAVLDRWLPANRLGVNVVTTVSLPHTAPEQVVAAAPVDVSVLKALVGDDPSLIRELLQDFRISADKIALELRAACAVRDAAASAAAHKLKASARNVGALALGGLCADIEAAGMTGNFDDVATLERGFEMEMRGVDNFLKSAINSNVNNML